MINRSQWNFAHVTTCAKLLWCVQNFVVIGREHFKQEHWKFWLNVLLVAQAPASSNICMQPWQSQQVSALLDTTAHWAPSIPTPAVNLTATSARRATIALWALVHPYPAQSEHSSQTRADLLSVNAWIARRGNTVIARDKPTTQVRKGNISMALCKTWVLPLHQQWR